MRLTSPPSSAISFSMRCRSTSALSFSSIFLAPTYVRTCARTRNGFCLFVFLVSFVTQVTFHKDLDSLDESSNQARWTGSTEDGRTSTRMYRQTAALNHIRGFYKWPRCLVIPGLLVELVQRRHGRRPLIQRTRFLSRRHSFIPRLPASVLLFPFFFRLFFSVTATTEPVPVPAGRVRND